MKLYGISVVIRLDTLKLNESYRLISTSLSQYSHSGEIWNIVLNTITANFQSRWISVTHSLSIPIEIVQRNSRFSLQINLTHQLDWDRLASALLQPCLFGSLITMSLCKTLRFYFWTFLLKVQAMQTSSKNFFWSFFHIIWSSFSCRSRISTF